MNDRQRELSERILLNIVLGEVEAGVSVATLAERFDLEEAEMRRRLDTLREKYPEEVAGAGGDEAPAQS